MPGRADGSLAVAIGPDSAPDFLAQAVEDGGGMVTAPEYAAALIWAGPGPSGLHETLQRGRAITWVQLPSAGVERYVDLLDEQHTWTCAKGIYGPQVAEHALALTLAGLHCLPQLAHAHSWQRTVCRSIAGRGVTIVGGGGIARDLLDLLAPFGALVTVVRRHPAQMAGATRVVGSDDLLEALHDADAVILAAPLTPETHGMIGSRELRAMKDDAWLVNVGRGALVQTDELVTALREGRIGGAALDVTDPEPLPDGHPLWSLDNCLITPHCANPPDRERAAYVRLICENVRRRIEGKELEGLIDPSLRY